MKKGFIATTLIYSFFLIFCTVLLSYIAISYHNKNLVARANEDIRKDIAEKTVGNSSIGSYINLKLSSRDYDTSNIKWIVFNTEDDYTELISASIVYTAKDIASVNSALSSFSNDCIPKKPRLVTTSDFNIMKNSVDSISVIKILANVDSTSKEGTNYVVIDSANNTPKKYTYNEPGEEDDQTLTAYKNTVFANARLIVLGSPINVRLVITLPSDLKITGGSGTYSNPYNIKTNSCFQNLSLVNKIMSSNSLSTAADDYGTSYYFEGSIDNNYVIFANRCWRIIRITGNGATKMILQSNTNSCKDSIKFNQAQLLDDTSYNTPYDNNAYIGFKYGNINSNNNSANYLETHANDVDSTILAKLKRWYDNIYVFTAAEKNKIADVIWCNDKKPKDPTNGIGTNNTEYWGHYRIENKTPSFKCLNVTGNDNLSKFTATDSFYGNASLGSYKIGLITADEAFLSGVNGSDVVYLIDKANYSFWTMTPSEFKNNEAYVYAINEYGQIVSTRVGSTLKIRPVIALIPNILATGTGTMNDPYVIQ